MNHVTKSLNSLSTLPELLSKTIISIMMENVENSENTY